MVNQTRNDGLSLALSRLFNMERSLKRHHELDKQWLLAIYDHISRTQNYSEQIISLTIRETDEICKCLIRNYHIIQSLSRGNFPETEIFKAIDALVSEVKSLTESVKSSADSARQQMGTPEPDPFPGLSTQQSAREDPDQIQWMEIPLPKTGERTPTHGNLREIELILIHRFMTYSDQMTINRQRIEAAISRFTRLMSSAALNHHAYRYQKMSFIRTKLEVFLTELVQKSAIADRNLPDFIEELILRFLSHFSIDLMPTFPGDQFNVNKHRIIREEPIPALADDKKNTIIEVQRTGFMKEGQTFFPAMVVIQI